MIIQNGTVFCEDLKFRQADIRIANGFFTSDPEYPLRDDLIVDASGCYVIPGLIDIHFHGALGFDVCDASPESFRRIAAYEAQHGITAICPATLTLPPSVLTNVLALGADYAAATRHPCSRADLIGFNMEGPFISYGKKGAQNPDYILPCDVQMTEDFLDASRGLLKIIGLAPEINPDFERYIHSVRDDVTVSLAHTDCDYDTARRAFQAGAGHLVHLYNAMRDFRHRDPGPIGAAMDEIRCNPGSDITCELICDGIHVHPSAVRAAFRLMGYEHILLISDSLRSTGMPDGEYDLGGERTIKSGPYCRLKEDGNIAGSVSNLMDCLRTAVLEMGIPLEQAVACATIQPARRIHADPLYGSIEPGKRGNAVLLDQTTLQIRAVIKDGLPVKNENEREG